MQSRLRTVGHCIRAVDGDTILAKIECPCCKITSEQRIRLARIDAPEINGPTRGEGLRSKAALGALVDHQDIEVDVSRRWPDRYGRVLAEVYLDGCNISDWMLQHKLARRYKENRADLAHLSAIIASTELSKQEFRDLLAVAPLE